MGILGVLGIANLWDQLQVLLTFDLLTEGEDHWRFQEGIAPSKL